MDKDLTNLTPFTKEQEEAARDLVYWPRKWITKDEGLKLWPDRKKLSDEEDE